MRFIGRTSPNAYTLGPTTPRSFVSFVSSASKNAGRVGAAGAAILRGEERLRLKGALAWAGLPLEEKTSEKEDWAAA